MQHSDNLSKLDSRSGSIRRLSPVHMAAGFKEGRDMTTRTAAEARSRARRTLAFQTAEATLAAAGLGVELRPLGRAAPWC